VSYEPAPRIRPEAPGPSLITAARTLPTGINWSTGIAWTPVCQPSFGLKWCPPAVNRSLGNTLAAVHTMPFLIYTPQSCALPLDTADMEQVVRDLTEVHTAYGLADALWMGTGLPSDTEDNTCPTLRRSAMDVSPSGSALDLDDGVAQLLAHYEDCTGGSGGAVIHMPSELLVYALGGGAGGARLCWPEGTIYRGPAGSKVVAGPGYPNGRTPPGPFGAGPQIGVNNYQGSEVNTAWIYITGPIEYAVSPVRALPEGEHDRVPVRTNIYDVWGERDAIVRFDPCCVFGTEVINLSPMPELS
jgi:hypothetical protein